MSNTVVALKNEVRNNGRVLRRIYDMLSNGQQVNAANDAVVHSSGLRGQLPFTTVDQLRTLDYDLSNDDDLFRELVFFCHQKLLI